jgi:hypothetical protein
VSGGLLRGERGEGGLGDLGTGHPDTGGLAEGRVGVHNGAPDVVADTSDGLFDLRVQPDSDRHIARARIAAAMVGWL